jgi:hypothetical protein
MDSRSSRPSLRHTRALLTKRYTKSLMFWFTDSYAILTAAQFTAFIE